MAIPKYDDLYGSEYVSPEDFTPGQRIKVQIARFEILELTVAKGGRAIKNQKCVLTVNGTDGKPRKKKIAVNKTSAKKLAAAWTKDFQKWVGHWITVEGGDVNGKAATLLHPVRDNTTPAPASVTHPQETGDETLSDDLAIDENAIPDVGNE